MTQNEYYVSVNPTITARVLGSIDGLMFDLFDLCPRNLKPEQAENFSKVDMTDVNHMVLRRKDDGSFTIVQANGYSPEKGLFTRLYD